MLEIGSLTQHLRHPGECEHDLAIVITTPVSLWLCCSCLEGVPFLSEPSSMVGESCLLFNPLNQGVANKLIVCSQGVWAQNSLNNDPLMDNVH